jgi:predicted  nucleic acid-binding Zn-ribbon protein
MSTDMATGFQPWEERIAHIAAEIEELKARVRTECLLAHARLDERVSAVETELRSLREQVASIESGGYARWMEAQLADLKAQGDAAYDLLQATVLPRTDPTEQEIKRLEAVAATTTGEARRRLNDRIAELRRQRGESH